MVQNVSNIQAACNALEPDGGWPADQAEAEIAQRKSEIEMLCDMIAELTKALSNRAADQRRADAAERRTRELEQELEKLGYGNVEKITSQQSYDQHALDVAGYLSRFETEDIVPVVMRAFRKIDGDRGGSLREDIPKQAYFQVTLKQLNAKRDRRVAAYMEEQLSATRFSVLRLVTGISRRECSLIHQTFKYHHLSNGRRRRRMLCDDSSVPMPAGCPSFACSQA